MNSHAFTALPVACMGQFGQSPVQKQCRGCFHVYQEETSCNYCGDEAHHATYPTFPCLTEFMTEERDGRTEGRRAERIPLLDFATLLFCRRRRTRNKGRPAGRIRPSVRPSVGLIHSISRKMPTQRRQIDSTGWVGSASAPVEATMRCRDGRFKQALSLRVYLTCTVCQSLAH